MPDVPFPAHNQFGWDDDLKAYLDDREAKQAAAVADAIAAHPSAASADPVLVFKGDSITQGGTGGGVVSFPTSASQGLSEAATIYNLGVGGQNVATMLANVNEITSKYVEGRLNVCVIYVGINDVNGGRSAAATYADLVNLHGLVRAAGFKTVAATITGSTVGGSGPDSVRLTYNTSIRNGWATFADALADVGGDAVLGLLATTADKYYFSDLIHPAPAGHAIIADYVRGALGRIGVAVHQHKGPNRIDLMPQDFFLNPGDNAAVALVASPCVAWSLVKTVSSRIWAGVRIPDHWASYVIGVELVNMHSAGGTVNLVPYYRISPKSGPTTGGAIASMPLITLAATDGSIEGRGIYSDVNTPVLVGVGDVEHSVSIARDIGADSLGGPVGLVKMSLHAVSFR